ncbi:MAG: tetratricopeptide repeat protein [Acidobacteriaceae bacterium]
MPSYNQSILHPFLLSLVLFITLPLLAIAQSTQPIPGSAADHRAGQLLLVLPFENKSTAPGLEWIGESFPEVLNQRMAEPSLFIISREDRIFALDRMGIPPATNPSRATVFTVAQAMDVDYVIVGSYNYDGRSFSAGAQVLDMKGLHLSNAVTESGPLTDLISIQTALAFDLLSELPVGQLPPRNQFIANQPQVRLDALENYVRGVIANSQPDKVRRFKEAVRISPDYDYAKLQLARSYFQGRDYEQAAAWFSKLPRSSPLALEANFFYGICEYQLGDMGKSEEAFRFVAHRMPLTEVENNLGVVTVRTDRAAAAELFRRAVQADARDADYRFNYAVALSQTGDFAEAMRQAKEAMALRPGDAEARALLDQLGHPPAATLPVAAAAPAPQPDKNLPPQAAAARTFFPRLKRNYDETAFRQAELEMHNVEEMALAGKGPVRHAQSHIDRGNEMLAHGFLPEAEAEFREAVTLDPRLAAAHLGLARIGLKKKDVATAGAEADRALAIDPGSAEARKLKQEISAKPTGKEAGSGSR